MPSIQCSLECFFVHLVLCILIEQTDAFLSKYVYLTFISRLVCLLKFYEKCIVMVCLRFTGNFTIIEMENSDRKQMFVHLKSYKYINHRQNTFNNGKFCTFYYCNKYSVFVSEFSEAWYNC